MAITEWGIHRTAIGQSRVQIILCDDDPLFLAAFREEVVRTFQKLNVGSDITVFGKLEQIPPARLEACDMAFLDIDFEDEAYNGIDIARRLRAVNSRALIFFVTNFIDYAPAGYEVQAFRYILKRDMGEVLERYIMQAMEHFAEGQEFLRLQSRDEAADIPLEQILYLEVMDHSVSIHARDTSHTLGTTLSSLEERLEAHGFLRIHKSYLVNMRHVRKFRSRECLLDNGMALAVSEKNYAQQKQKYLLWKGLR